MDVIERGAASAHLRGLDLAERQRWFRDELTGVRTTASVELTDGLRELRENARVRLTRPEPHYPVHLAAAVTELSRRHLHRTHDLTHAAAVRALSGLDVSVPAFVVEWSPPSVTPPPHRRRWSAEEAMIALSSVIGAATLVRWPLLIGAFPAPVTAGVLVSLLLTVAMVLASSKRSNVERAKLERWTAEVLADTRSVLESAFVQRDLDAQRRMRRVFQHQANRLDGRQ